MVADEDLPTYANALDGRENAAKKLEEAVARVHSVLCLSLEAVVGNVTAEVGFDASLTAPHIHYKAVCLECTNI